MKSILSLMMILTISLTSVTTLANKPCALPDVRDVGAVEAYVHDRIDRFTPYRLGLNEETNSMEKIKDRKLTALHMFPLNVENMWQRINQELYDCGFEFVSRKNQEQAERAGDVMALVLAKMNRQKVVTFHLTYVVD